MARRDLKHDERTDRTASARAAREEVADVLADGLWTLICTGRWPGRGGSGAPVTVEATAYDRGSDTAQPVEIPGV